MATVVEPSTDFSHQGVDWSHRFVAVYKCSPTQQDSAQATAAKTVDALRIGDRSALVDDSDLQRVVRALHKDFLKKREYRYADNPTTRVMTFQQPEEGKENEARQNLDRLRRAQSLRQIESESSELASRYLGTQGVRSGVLLFLVSHGEAGGKEPKDRVSEDCVFIFKCDFEPVSEVAPEELFHQIEDAIIEKAQKAAVYPRFDPDQNRFDDTLVRIFDEKGETQYWLDYLQLGERKFERTTQSDALHEILEKSFPKVAKQHGEELRQPPRRRPLDDGRRLVKKEVRLTTPQAKRVGRKVAQKTGGAPMVTFSLGAVRVTAPVSQYGSSWIVAEEGGQRYVLIKGDLLEARTRMPTVLDVVRFESLKKAAEHLGVDCQ